MMKKAFAFRWSGGELHQIPMNTAIAYDDLIAIDRQKQMACKNIAAFVNGSPALNLLLWGEKGCGKSSLIKYITGEFGKKGLRLIEFDQTAIGSIYDLYATLRQLPEYRFLIYFDDISFDDDDIFYRKFKSIIEGGLEETPANVLFAATSNRRHLISENASDTNSIYDRDEANEKNSLFARFGLALGFYPLPKKDYLKIVDHYLNTLSVIRPENWEQDAENFAVDRGGRSGRIAKQYAIYRTILATEFTP